MNCESNDPYGGVKPMVRLLNLLICMGITTWVTFWVALPYIKEFEEGVKAMEREAYEKPSFLYWVMIVGSYYLIGYFAFLLVNKLTTGKSE